MESETLGQITDWLNEQEIKKDTYKSHKAAIISSSDPFGLFACHISNDGAEYWYINGKLDCVDYDGQTVRFDK